MAKGDPFTDRLGTGIQNNRSSNTYEEKMVLMLQRKKVYEAALKEFKDPIDKLKKGSLDVPAFLEELAPQMFEELLYTLQTSESEKVRVDVAKDILDRAGYGKINKAVIGSVRVDRHTAKSELINSIISMAKKTDVIKIKENNEDTIDIDAVDSVSDNEVG